MLGGGALLLVALVPWSLRERAPGWAAKSVIATADFTSTGESDDQRVKRAFVAVPQGPFESGWDPQPNGLRSVRHSRLWVRAPSETQALAQAPAMPKAMSATCDGEG